MFKKNKEKLDSRQIKEDRFKRIAGRRVQEILHKMRLLRNCADKSNYSYNEDQVKKIAAIIDEEWRKTKSEFNKNSSKKKEFSL